MPQKSDNIIRDLLLGAACWGLAGGLALMAYNCGVARERRYRVAPVGTMSARTFQVKEKP